ncbi:hypothetical protein [Companilactobacillus sp. DQM5]|uniref:hypothetical protein n=1 Tax=Companilactobacillus sp. DQM5 TaxID=3463359 RepID=UPI004057EF47
MLFFGNARDYEVTCIFKNIEGQEITKKRICHNVSRREAREGMKHYIFRSYSDSMDIHKPIKIDTKPAH